MDKTCAWMWLSLDTFRSFLNMLSQFLLSAFYFPYFVKKYLNYSNNIWIFEPFQRFEYIRTFFKISNNIRIRIRKFSDLQMIFGFVKKKRFVHLCSGSFRIFSSPCIHHFLFFTWVFTSRNNITTWPPWPCMLAPKQQKIMYLLMYLERSVYCEAQARVRQGLARDGL